jgi:hypothetical protein
MKNSIEEARLQIESELARDRMVLRERRRYAEDLEADILAREARLEQDVKELHESNLARAQHDADVRFAERMVQWETRHQNTYLPDPSGKDTAAALAHFGVSPVVFDCARACVEINRAPAVIVAMHREATHVTENAQRDVAREAAIQRLTDEEFAAMRALEEKLEG